MQNRQVAALISLSLASGIFVIAGCDVPLNLDAGKNRILSPGTGAIQVRIQGDFSKLRSTQATITDVDRLVIDVLANDNSTASQTINKNDLANGQTGRTIEGLPPGETLVAATAYDVSNKSIGAATASVEIVIGQVKPVDLTVQLEPTYVYASPTPTPPTGIQTNVTIVDGPVIVITPTPTPTPTPEPTPTPYTTNVASIVLSVGPSSPAQPSVQLWTRNPQLLTSGSTINVSVTGGGVSNFGGTTFIFSPDGHDFSNAQPMFPEFKYMALIGRFGESGSPFHIGSGSVLTVPNAVDLDQRTLYLAVNSNPNTYTSGAWNVTVSKN